MSKVERVSDLESECADILKIKIPNSAIFFPMILISFSFLGGRRGRKGAKYFLKRSLSVTCSIRCSTALHHMLILRNVRNANVFQFFTVSFSKMTLTTYYKWIGD